MLKKPKVQHFYHIFLKKCLFTYTYWHFGNAKTPYFRTEKAPYIGICQFCVLLLSERPEVQVLPGTQKTTFHGWLFVSLIGAMKTQFVYAHSHVAGSAVAQEIPRASQYARKCSRK